MELKLGAEIKKLRTRKGLTQEELAGKIGVSFQAVSKWETNTTTPDIALLPTLALFFGVSIDTLFSMDRDDYIARIYSMIRDEASISSDDFVWAERYLKGILSDEADNNEVRLLLIELYEHRENRDSLSEGRLCEAGILIDPTNVTLNEKLLRIREKRHENDRLIEFYEPLIQKNPKNYVITENLIKVYIKGRYFDKAKQLISTAKAFESRAAYDLYSGDIALALGKESEAKVIWENIAKKYNKDEWVLFETGERFNKTGDYDTAINLYEKSYTVSPAPKAMDSLYSRAFLFTKLGRINEAIEMWETIIKSLSEDYHIKEGETVDWPKRELEKLR